MIQRAVRALERWQGPLRLVLGASALVLGFWGWTLRDPPAGVEGWFNNAFRTLQLITLQFPREIQADIPWQLQVARFLMPLLAVFETFRLLVASIRNPVRHAAMPFVRDHVIVCGSTREARTAMRAFARKGRHYVVGIGVAFTAGQRDRLERDGVAIIEGDLRDSVLLERAGIERAAALFLFDADDVNNLNIAMMGLRGLPRKRQGRPFDLVVLLENDDLAEQIDAALDGLARDRAVRYHRFSVTAMGSQMAFEATPPAVLKADPESPTHVLVLGFSTGASAVVRDAIRLTQDCPGKKPVLTVIGDESEIAAFDAFRRARPGLELVVDLRPLAVASGDPLPGDRSLEAHLMAVPPVTLAFVCRPDARAILSALALRRNFHIVAGQDFPIHVHQTRTDRFFEAIRASDVRQVDMTRIFPFGGRVPFERVRKLIDGGLDATARAVHDRYLAELSRQGASAGGSPMGWDELSENLRDANRAAAAHIPVKLAYVGAVSIAAFDGGSAAGEFFEPDEIEALAEMEHRRWCADRILSGWTYGRTRDDTRRLHPDLVEYAELSEGARDKDRSAIRALPEVLSLAGLVPVRMSRIEVACGGVAAQPPGAVAAALCARAAEVAPRPIVAGFAISEARQIGAVSACARAFADGSGGRGHFDLALPAGVMPLFQSASSSARHDLRWLIEKARVVYVRASAHRQADAHIEMDVS